MTWFSELPPADPPAVALPPMPAPPDALLPADALLIDVRSYAEYMAGHLPGARSLPLPLLEQEAAHKLPDKSVALILYCSTGARAEQALGLMQHMGYSQAINGGAAVHLAQRLRQPLQRGL